ncbi:MAG: F0F1 ATP synthase subunit epsilon [Spirochaetes bacterium]|nr:F0F1 ATP synthase subunit epsilon [Spirochaetota bacterium]
MALKLDCVVLTPERVLYEGKVDFAVVQAYDGERGFLYNHVNFMSKLGYGMLRLYNEDRIDYYHIEGGLVECHNNKMVVLAENALKKEELSADELKKKLADLTAQEKPLDAKERFLRQIEIEKTKRRLKLALLEKK